MDKDKEIYILQEIEDMLKKDAIEIVDLESPGFYSIFFLVPKKDGGQRPILNLKALNRFIKHSKFKMETVDSIVKVLKRG